MNRDKWAISSTSAGLIMAFPPQPWLSLTSWELWRNNRGKWLWDFSGQATHWGPRWWSIAVQGLGEQVRSCDGYSCSCNLASVLTRPVVGRYLLCPGHLSVSTPRCRLTKCVPDGAAHENAESIQHSNPGPVLLLLQRHIGACPKARPAASQSVSLSHDSQTNPRALRFPQSL